MRHQWYGDGRDLIKWSVLIHLAKIRKLKRIVQAAYIRPDSPRPTLGCRQKSIPVPELVWVHFRDIHDIKRLATVTGIDINVIDTVYEIKTRARYTQDVIEQYCSTQEGRTLIFLDPDTGIAERNAKPQHVTPCEVRKIWASLRHEDWLVLYQHSNRHKRWLWRKRSEFKRATGAHPIETFRAKSGARDVAFFCAQKL